MFNPDKYIVQFGQIHIRINFIAGWGIFWPQSKQIHFAIFTNTHTDQFHSRLREKGWPKSFSYFVASSKFGKRCFRSQAISQRTIFLHFWMIFLNHILTYFPIKLKSLGPIFLAWKVDSANVFTFRMYVQWAPFVFVNGRTNQKPHKYGRSFNSDLIVQSFFAGQSWVAHNTMISNTILLWRPTIGCGLVIALVLVCKQLFTKQQQLLAICHIFDILQDVSYHPWYESFASIKKMHISFSEIDFSNFQDSKQWWLTLTLNKLDIFSSAKCQELFTQFLSSTDPRFQRAVDFLLTSYI